MSFFEPASSGIGFIFQPRMLLLKLNLLIQQASFKKTNSPVTRINISANHRYVSFVCFMCVKIYAICVISHADCMYTYMI